MAYKQKRGKVWYAYVTMPPDADHDKPWVKSFSKDPETGDRWTTGRAALDWAREHEIEANRPKAATPPRTDITWNELWARWDPHSDGDLRTEVDENTADTYTSLYQTHIGPRYGPTPIRDTANGEVTAWLTALRTGAVETGPEHLRRTRTYKPRTPEAIRTLMRLMLGDAHEKGHGLLEFNPLDVRRNRNRGRRVDRVQPDVRPKLSANPQQVLAAAVNVHQIVGPGTIAGIGAFLRVLTAGFSALRPGESAALDRANCHVRGNEPRLLVDDEAGTWEQRAKVEPRLKNPKSGLGRDAVIPIGLAALLAAWFEYQDGEVVFPPHEGERWSRWTWSEKWGRAVGGGIVTLRASNGYVTAGEYVLERAAPGLEFKGLRRVWNIWATERAIPEVARKAQLGHAMDDEMQAAYSVVSPVLEAQIRTAFQDAWVEAFRGYAGVAALEICSRFAPGAAKANREQIASSRLALPPGR